MMFADKGLKRMNQTLSFEGSSIVVDKPSGWDGERAFILGHGAGQSMDSSFMSFFHSGLATCGFLSVKFNFRYMELGRRPPSRQPKLRATYRGVIDLIQTNYGPRTLVIGGKSMGGRVSSYIAGEISEIGGLVFLGYPLHPPGQPDKMRDDHLYELDKPMLFISGTRDSLAKQDLLDGVVKKIGERATLLWVEGGDHSLRVKKSDKDSLPAALEAIQGWSDSV